MDREGNILHGNAHTGDLLRRFFGLADSWKAVLPDPVRAWLKRQLSVVPVEPMRIESGGLSLTIRASALDNDRHLLLFQESDQRRKANQLQTLGLSKREAEVLLWIGEGKTNIEIGAILGISSRTVGKHLEMIFSKIQVESRVAAALRVKEVLLS